MSLLYMFFLRKKLIVIITTAMASPFRAPKATATDDGINFWEENIFLSGHRWMHFLMELVLKSLQTNLSLQRGVLGIAME